MILLIQEQKSNFHLGADIFKFHYDSINSAGATTYNCTVSKFKFHYDSINSVRPQEDKELDLLFKFHYDSINSLL